MYEPDFRPAGVVAAKRQPRTFWRRQFGAQATKAQRRFDVAFGFVMPVLCFVFDPIVFRGWDSDELGILGPWRLYAYTVSALEMAALAAWLLRSEGAGRPPAMLGGVLLAGGMFSLALGVVLLPFSLIGLLVYFIGALGFTPLFTAVVYLRNGWRAANPGRSGDDMSWRDAAEFVFGLVFALGAPVVAPLSTLFD